MSAGDDKSEIPNNSKNKSNRSKSELTNTKDINNLGKYV
jgi:hypothetical protein